MFPNTGDTINVFGDLNRILSVDDKVVRQGSSFYSQEAAQKESLRRAARARCIEKIADCEDKDQNTEFFFDSDASKPLRIKCINLDDKGGTVEAALRCNNYAYAQTLRKDPDFGADYKLYLGVN